MFAARPGAFIGSFAAVNCGMFKKLYRAIHKRCVTSCLDLGVTGTNP